jgi:hypothetical protein
MCFPKPSKSIANSNVRHPGPIEEGSAGSSERLLPGGRVPRLSHCEGDVTVLDHVLNLSPHCTMLAILTAPPATWRIRTRQAKQNQPVHHQHRPEHRQVEDLEPAAEEANRNRLSRRVPELELGQPAHKRPELLVLFRRESACISVFHALILLERRVKFRRQKREEEVQQVDAERVCDCGVLAGWCLDARGHAWGS